MKVFKIKVKRANTIQNELRVVAALLLTCYQRNELNLAANTPSVCISVLFCLMSTAALMNDPCS